MKRQVLQKLEIKDLQHYKGTLVKRIQQLKIFNVELAKDNADLAARVNHVRIQLAKKPPKKVTKGYNPQYFSNFDFDDLYRLGVQKVGKFANKSTMMGLISASNQKIKQGFGFVKNYMSNQKKQPNQSKLNNATPSNQGQQQDGQVVNQNADFNSYDVGVGTYFKNYQPHAQSNLQENYPQQSTSQQQDSKLNEQQKIQTSNVQKKTSVRRKIFDRGAQQQMLARKKMRKQKHSSSEQQVEQPVQGPTSTIKKEQNSQNDQQQDNQYAIKQDKKEQNKNTEIDKQQPQQSKEQAKNSENKCEKPKQQQLNKKQSKKVIKQTEVEPNTVMDVENGSESQQQQNEKQPSPKRSPMKSQDKEIKVKQVSDQKQDKDKDKDKDEDEGEQ